MTKNKARKAAARERAARTGERYVVARRALENQPETYADGVLHWLTHLVPGVPAHVAGGLQRAASQPHRPQTQFVRQHGEPKVLVGLQHRIAQLVRAE